jgi:hypothetical protein
VRGPGKPASTAVSTIWLLLRVGLALGSRTFSWLDKQSNKIPNASKALDASQQLVSWMEKANFDDAEDSISVEGEASQDGHSSR